MTGPGPEPPGGPLAGVPALGLPAKARAAVPAPGLAGAAPPPVAPRVVGVAAPGQRAAAAAAPAAAAAAAAPAAAPPAPPSGPPTRAASPPAGPAPEQRWRTRRYRRLRRLRIGHHTAPADALDQLQLRRETTGVRIGRSQSGEPVALRLFAARPVRAVLVAEEWAVRLLAFRALRFGARVVAYTPAPAGWIDLGRRATGRTDRVAVLAPGAVVGMPASADTPVLRISGAAGAGADLPGWTTQLVVLPPVTVTDLAIRPDRARQLGTADLVLSQRMKPRELAAIAPVLGLPRELIAALPTLPDGVLAVLTRGGAEYAWVDPSEAERATLSPADRRPGAG